MTRGDVLARVATIVPCDDLERLHKEDTIAWIGSGVEICRISKPATPPRHLVCYFVVVDGDHVLLVDHKKARRWLPSGGHVEPGEKPEQAVAREAEEGFGLRADFLIPEPLMLTITHVFGPDDAHGHEDVSLWYVLKGDRTVSYKFDKGEFNEIRWFPMAGIPFGQSDPHMQRFVNKYAAYLAGDLDLPDLRARLSA